MQEAEVQPTIPIEVISFTEEEGQRFADGVLGSSVAIGERPVEEALSLTDGDGRTLRSTLKEIGYHGSDNITAKNWDSWLELHVEQGKRLETAGTPIGVVNAIAGVVHLDMTIKGEADHAGSTPMTDRRDALAAASEVVLNLEQEMREFVEERSDTAVGTVGKMVVSPNATNVIPGRVELGIDIRDVKFDIMIEIENKIRNWVAEVERDREVKVTTNRSLSLSPTQLSNRCIEAATKAAKKQGVGVQSLHSGAFHDTMNVAKVTDSGLLFAPSKDGVSHSPQEWTSWEDCKSATDVLAESIAILSNSS